MKNQHLRPRLAAFICAAVFSLLTVTGQAQQSASSTLQKMHNHVRPAISNGQAAPVGLMSTTQRMNLAIMLPLRNQAELTSFLNRLYDPSSPDYHHFLSVAEFTEKFGPSEQDYQAVVDFARANGFAISDMPVNRMLVDIDGSVDQIQRAFHVTMRVYQHPTENRTFHSPDREPSLALSVPISHIAGLNDFSIPHPRLKRAAVGQAIHPNAGGSGPAGAFRPSDMRAAYYGGTALTGSGQSVAMVEFDGYNMADVTGDMGGTAFTVPIVNVLIDGASAGSDGDDGEQALDIAQAIGMAPGLSSVRVYIAPGTTSIGVGDVDMFNKIASDNISKSISCSWGWNPDDIAQNDPIFQEYQAQGQTLFVASGDAGAYTGSNATDDSFPAEDVFVVAVGGTDLTTSGAGGPWASETAWPDSSGGPADNGFAIPSWQSGVASTSNGGSTTVRNIPDVAAEANFDNILCDDGTCTDNQTGGTSYAAPRWAGFIALVNQQSVANGNSTVGFINPAVYAIGLSTSFTSDFHDITSGNNNNGHGKSFNAVTGYDLVTGWGSPTGQNLINALAGAAAPDFSLSASPASLTVTQGNSGTSTITVTDINGFAGSVSLAASGLPSGVTAAFGTNPTTSTSVLTFTASATATTGTSTITVTGTSGTLTHTTTISLTISSAAAQQLLGNPGFENGTTTAPWTLTAGVINNSASEPPHSGSWDAWLDGYGRTHTDTATQTVTIPSTVTTATLSFWLHIDTAETTTTAMNDTLQVQVLNTSGTVLATLGTFSNLNHATGYQQHSFSMNSFIGQTVQIRFTGHENNSRQTSFVIDDTALNVQ
jgi:subtilase family serine protease